MAPRPQQTLDEILINSSNRGVSRLVLRMPPSALMETYQNAGLGKDTELGLIGEQRGVLNANRKRWADIERATVGLWLWYYFNTITNCACPCYFR